ncbi:enoyl-CoA hydratase/isomerase family protein [Actinomadura sp. HBU206391]|uniref:enoyl-CoA hydratase/isomerase family protein n=1 Tax=Actinomadura sp. HBU206391 TaxID=2731692 RepID=UPI001650085E|nr:enoyl-CoA hydratase/isomerase family protein [Actinomadura sp. HBU206391]MBC6456515.1 enoyl-CoA hydratase/isomerase family protein [Actinomadura sp. HBU206391]
MRTVRDGHLLTLTLGRPDKLNAMNAPEWRALHAAVRKAEDDEGVRVIVLRAEGRAFCAGNDLTAMAECRTRAQARAYFLDTMLPAFAAMATSPLPIIAEVGGMAIGGGVELIQFCDLAVAARSATFRLPEVRVGVWPTVFAGAAPSLGQRRLAQVLALTTEPLTAEQARAAGLVTHVVDDAELAEATAEVARGVANGARAAVGHTKRFANRELIEHGLPAVRAALEVMIEQTMFTPEYEHGVAGFTGRREAADG